jgi:hypothetical protein
MGFGFDSTQGMRQLAPVIKEHQITLSWCYHLKYLTKIVLRCHPSRTGTLSLPGSRVTLYKRKTIRSSVITWQSQLDHQTQTGLDHQHSLNSCTGSSIVWTAHYVRNTFSWGRLVHSRTCLIQMSSRSKSKTIVLPLEHLKIETRLIDERFPSVMGQCVILTTQVCRRYSK